MIFLWTACSPGTTWAQNPVKERTKLEITITTSSTVNPDEKARPSPIKIWMYELKSDALFEAADYFGLANSDKATLGGDLLSKEEFIMRPDETRKMRFLSNAETTAIGFLAGYSNLSISTWRAIKRLEPAPEAAWYRAIIPANKLKLQVEIQEHDIKLRDIE